LISTIEYRQWMGKHRRECILAGLAAETGGELEEVGERRLADRDVTPWGHIQSPAETAATCAPCTAGTSRRHKIDSIIITFVVQVLAS